MNKAAFVLLITLCFVLETQLSVLGIRPNLTVLPVYYVGLRHGAVRGLLFGALMGIVADSIGGGLLGPNMLSKGTVGFLASFMRGGLFTWTPLLGLLAVAALTLVDGALAFASVAVFAQVPVTLPQAALVASGQAGANAIAGAFIKPVEERWDGG